MSVSVERISELIGLIYDCAIDPSAWQGTLEKIRLTLDFHNAVVEVYALPAASRILGIVTGPAPEFVASMPRYGSDIVDLWGGAGRFSQFPLEEPIVGSHVVAPDAMRANRYYQEWCEPQGIIDAVGVAVVRDDTTVASLGLGRHASAGEITEAELAPLRLLTPHLRRAISINRLLDVRSIQAATFAATLDGLKAAIVFVDERMRVAYANTAASDLLKAGDLMGLHQGALRFMDETAGAELAKAVALALRSEARLGRRGIGIPARRAKGNPAVVHVLPLGGGAKRAALAGYNVAALFITPGAITSDVPTDALARLYELTPTEARIMELVAGGRTLSEAGAQLGIALSTVKSHLKQIFVKTGCQRQADLITFANTFRRPF